jgi:hypothetical protein
LVHTLGNTVITNLVDFTLSPGFVCENMLPTCIGEREYKLLDENDYIRKMLRDKPLEIRNDDYIDNLYAKMGRDRDERKTFKMV